MTFTQLVALTRKMDALWPVDKAEWTKVSIQWLHLTKHYAAKSGINVRVLRILLLPRRPKEKK